MFCLLAFAIFACAQASTAAAAESKDELRNSRVVFIVDAADLSVSDRKNVLEFTEASALRALHKGSNVGVIVDGDVYMKSAEDYQGMSEEMRSEMLTDFHEEVERSWGHRELVKSSTLGKSLKVLKSELDKSQSRDMVVATLITGAKAPDMMEISEAYNQLTDVKYLAVLIGSHIDAEEFGNLADSPCFTWSVESAEQLRHDLLEQARLLVVLRMVVNGGYNVDDQEALCDEVATRSAHEMKQLEAVAEKETNDKKHHKAGKGKHEKNETPAAAPQPAQPVVLQQVDKIEEEQRVRDNDVAKQVQAAERESMDHLRHEDESAELPVVSTTTSQELLCYRCDGCDEKTPNPNAVISCGAAPSSCFVARIGFGADSTYVRGCEPRSKCIDVTSPVLVRRCCSSNTCNGAMSPTTNQLSLPGAGGSHSPAESKPAQKHSTRRTTPPTTTPTTTLPEFIEIDTSNPFYNVEIYFVLDFATISISDEVELVATAKKLAADAAVLGADVALVYGTTYKHLSQRQVAYNFDSAKGRPRREEILRRFDSDLHIVPSSDSIYTRKVNTLGFVTANATVSTIQRSFDFLSHKISPKPKDTLSPAREVFVVFVTGGELTTSAADSMWQTHDKLFSMSPRYVTLLIGSKTEKTTFQELIEGNQNPQCQIMRFATVKQLSEAEDDIAKLFVELVDYVRAHRSLSHFTCDSFVASLPISAPERQAPVIAVQQTIKSEEVVEKPAAARSARHEEEDVHEEHAVVQIDLVDKDGKTRETVVVLPPSEQKDAHHGHEDPSTHKRVRQPKAVEVEVEHVPSGKDGEEDRVVVVVGDNDKEVKARLEQERHHDEPSEKHSHHHDGKVAEVKAKKADDVPKAMATSDKKVEDAIADMRDAAKKIVEEIKEEAEELLHQGKKPQEKTSGTKTAATNVEEQPAKKQPQPKQQQQQPQQSQRNTTTGKEHSGKHHHKSNSANQLMCYQCEHCSASPPPSTQAAPCGDGSLTSPDRGVCFIQRVGDKYTRGCIVGFECLETNSDVLTNYCCNSHNFCNDVLPKAQPSGSVSGGMTVSASVVVVVATAAISSLVL